MLKMNIYIHTQFKYSFFHMKNSFKRSWKNGSTRTQSTPETDLNAKYLKSIRTKPDTWRKKNRVYPSQCTTLESTYEIAAINSYIFRALKICSTETLLNKWNQFNIKKIPINSGYSKRIIRKLRINTIRPAQTEKKDLLWPLHSCIVYL